MQANSGRHTLLTDRTGSSAICVARVFRLEDNIQRLEPELFLTSKTPQIVVVKRLQAVATFLGHARLSTVKFILAFQSVA